MQGERLVLRAGTVMIIGAIVLRLLNLGGGLVQILRSPETTAVMLFLGTGRIVHPQQTESIPVPEETVPVETEPVETKAPETEESVSPEPEKAGCASCGAEQCQRLFGGHPCAFGCAPGVGANRAGADRADPAYPHLGKL